MPSSVPLYIGLEAWVGQPDITHETALNFLSPATLTAQAVYKTIINLPALTVNQLLNLAALFPAATACKFIALIDVTTIGQTFSVGTAPGAATPVKASSPFLWMPNENAPPNLYLSNPSATLASDILVVLVS